MNLQGHDPSPAHHPDKTPHGHPDNGGSNHPDKARHHPAPKGGGHQQKKHDPAPRPHHKPRDARRKSHRSAGLGDVTHAILLWHVPVPSDGGWMQ